MSGNVVVKGVVAQSTVDYVRNVHGDAAWERVLNVLSESDRIVMRAGGNVPLEIMGRFNEAFTAELCGGSRLKAQEEFRRMGAMSANKLLSGGGIFSLFARFVSPKQVLSRAESVIRTAYPGATVDVALAPDEGGGVITIHGMGGYPYGSQRLVGWLLRGLEIVGGKNARVRERNWDAGRIDSETYEIELSWDS
jgi:uncharacterized protein (TIGR02265 family)